MSIAVTVEYRSNLYIGGLYSECARQGWDLLQAIYYDYYYYYFEILILLLLLQLHYF